CPQRVARSNAACPPFSDYRRPLERQALRLLAGRRASGVPSLSISAEDVVNVTAEREKTLTINEIYHSIQGESTWTGQPCVFVRLTFCTLRCNYCDTEYAFYEGKKRTLNEIVDWIAGFRCPLVEVTGGEPLLQKNVLPLMS